MTRVQDYSATGAEPASVVQAVAAPAAALNMLAGDELIQFSVKPSLWFIPIVSARWVLTMVLLAAIVAIGSRGLWTWGARFAFNTFLAIAVLRLAVAGLQWASRLYVLTNRRVIRIKGVFNAEVAQCLLTRISGVEMRANWHQRQLRLGSIHMPNLNNSPIHWENVGRPAQIAEMLETAVRKAQFGEP
jgi:hypothetical protein